MDAETFSILKDTVQRFVEERLMPNEDRVENEDAVPEEIIQEMRDLGLFGMTVPEEFGGLGLTMSEEIEVLFQFGRTALAYRSVFGTTVGIGSQGLVWDGEDFRGEFDLAAYERSIKVGMFTFSPLVAVKLSEKLSAGVTFNLNYGMQAKVWMSIEKY